MEKQKYTPIPDNYEPSKDKVEPFDTVTLTNEQLNNIIDNLHLQIDFVLKFLLISNAIFFIAITTLAIIIFA